MNEDVQKIFINNHEKKRMLMSKFLCMMIVINKEKHYEQLM